LLSAVPWACFVRATTLALSDLNVRGGSGFSRTVIHKLSDIVISTLMIRVRSILALRKTCVCATVAIIFLSQWSHNPAPTIQLILFSARCWICFHELYLSIITFLRPEDSILRIRLLYIYLSFESRSIDEPYEYLVWYEFMKGLKP